MLGPGDLRPEVAAGRPGSGESNPHHMLPSVACTPSLAPRRMSRHPTVEVISRIALDAAAPLDPIAGAISPAVMTVGVVVLAHCDLTSQQVTHDVNEPGPDG